MDALGFVIIAGIIYLIVKDHRNPKTPAGPFPGGRGGKEGDEEDDDE